MVVNVSTVLRTFLLADATLVARIGTHLYSSRLPKGYAITSDAISYFNIGGDSPTLVVEDKSNDYQFDCWGETLLDAQTTFGLLYDALHSMSNETVGTDKLLYSELTSGPQDIIDPDTQTWFRVMSTFHVIARD